MSFVKEWVSASSLSRAYRKKCRENISKSERKRHRTVLRAQWCRTATAKRWWSLPKIRRKRKKMWERKQEGVWFVRSCLARVVEREARQFRVKSVGWRALRYVQFRIPDSFSNHDATHSRLNYTNPQLIIYVTWVPRDMSRCILRSQLETMEACLESRKFAFLKVVASISLISARDPVSTVRSRWYSTTGNNLIFTL